MLMTKRLEGSTDLREVQKELGPYRVYKGFRQDVAPLHLVEAESSVVKRLEMIGLEPALFSSASYEHDGHTTHLSA